MAWTDLVSIGSHVRRSDILSGTDKTLIATPAGCGKVRRRRLMEPSTTNEALTRRLNRSMSGSAACQERLHRHCLDAAHHSLNGVVPRVSCTGEANGGDGLSLM